MQPSLYVSGVGYAVGTCIRRAVKDFRKSLLKTKSKNDEIDAMVVGLMVTFIGIVIFLCSIFRQNLNILFYDDFFLNTLK